MNPDTAPASPGLVRALVVDTDRQADGLDFPAVVPWSSWRKRGLVLGLAILGLGLMIGSDPNLRIAARRLEVRDRNAYAVRSKVGPGMHPVLGVESMAKNSGRQKQKSKPEKCRHAWGI